MASAQMAYFPKAREVRKTQGRRGEKNRWEQREKEKVREGQRREKGNIARGMLVGVSAEHPCGWECGMGWGAR